MTVREWCSHTANVLYGATVFTIYRTGKQPVRAVAGRIPDELARLDALWITVTKINPDTMCFREVKVMIA